MRRPAAAAYLLASLVASASCVDEPSFTLVSSDLDGGAAGGSAMPVIAAADGMVLVPAAILPAKLTAAPGDPPGGKCTPIPFLGITCPDPGPGGPTQIAAFRIDRHETSLADYERCVSTGKCTAASRAPECATLADRPVTCVTRSQAAAFCAFAGKRLVRSLEHVAAAAGTAGRSYPWGNEPPAPDRLNGCGKECKGKHLYEASDPWPTAAPVGSLANSATPDGVLDLSGNVAEWVDAPASIVRGGDYSDGESSAVTSSAAVAAPESAPTIGFRCARDS